MIKILFPFFERAHGEMMDDYSDSQLEAFDAKVNKLIKGKDGYVYLESPEVMLLDGMTKADKERVLEFVNKYSEPA